MKNLGWKCCKPRFLTFDEFLAIPPCTTGKHSTVDDTPAAPKPSAPPADEAPKRVPTSTSAGTDTAASSSTEAPPSNTVLPIHASLHYLPSASSPAFRPKQPAPPATPKEDSDSDEPGAPVPAGITCRRRGCNAESAAGTRPPRPTSGKDTATETAAPTEGAEAEAAKKKKEEEGKGEKGEEADALPEKCVHHPGQPVFHEGSKGWSCCRRRVLEFDEFMRIEGCRTKSRHLFLGRGTGKKKKNGGGGGGAAAADTAGASASSASRTVATAASPAAPAAGGGDAPAADDGEGEYEILATVRHDFYQTPTHVHASLFLRRVDPARSSISIPSPATLALDLVTADGKRYRPEGGFPLHADVDAAKSTWEVRPSKVEFALAKKAAAGGGGGGGSWPALRADEKAGPGIIQSGRAGRA